MVAQSYPAHKGRVNPAPQPHEHVARLKINPLAHVNCTHAVVIVVVVVVVEVVVVVVVVPPRQVAVEAVTHNFFM